MSKGIGVGLIGLGVVGGGVVKLLNDSPLAMQRRKHVKFDLRSVAVRDPGKPRSVPLDGVVVTDDAMKVVDDPEVQVVVELTGAPPAYEWIRTALERGKDVVTANKAVIAEHGSVRLLADLTEFEGWDWLAAWDDLAFGIKHWNHIRKIALIGDAAWEGLAARIADKVTPADVRKFPAGDASAAMDWISRV